MSDKQKKMLTRIIISLVLFLGLMIAEHTGKLDLLPGIVTLLIYVAVYALIGYDIV